MANGLNVAALAALLEEFDRTVKRFDSPHYRAEWLASRGVLVPDALTDQQVDRMLQGGVHLYGDEVDGYSYDYEAPPLILALERIAKGEA